MEILDKNQIEEQLGSFSFWSGKSGNSLIGEMRYLGGIPAIDELKERDNIDTSKLLVVINKKPKGIEVSFSYGFKSYRIAFFDENLVYWTIEHQNEIFVKKSKSVVGRALLGGLLLGPVGAVVGGITGVGDKTVKMSDVDNVISLVYSYKETDCVILFTATNKQLKKVNDYFILNFREKYKTPDEVNFSKDKINSSSSLADELVKLKKLYDEEVITKEEFERSKEKLLR